MILASKVRIRILEIVSREGAISITSLARKSGLNHGDVADAIRGLIHCYEVEINLNHPKP